MNYRPTGNIKPRTSLTPQYAQPVKVVAHRTAVRDIRDK
jgi:hypothetical protein